MQLSESYRRVVYMPKEAASLKSPLFPGLRDPLRWFRWYHRWCLRQQDFRIRDLGKDMLNRAHLQDRISGYFNVLEMSRLPNEYKPS